MDPSFLTKEFSHWYDIIKFLFPDERRSLFEGPMRSNVYLRCPRQLTRYAQQHPSEAISGIKLYGIGTLTQCGPPGQPGGEAINTDLCIEVRSSIRVKENHLSCAFDLESASDFTKDLAKFTVDCSLDYLDRLVPVLYAEAGKTVTIGLNLYSKDANSSGIDSVFVTQIDKRA